MQSNKKKIIASEFMGRGLCWRVLNSFVASADIWKRLQKFGMLAFESKLLDVLIARNCGGGGTGVPFVGCFGGVELNSIVDCFADCTRVGSAMAVAWREKKTNLIKNQSHRSTAECSMHTCCKSRRQSSVLCFIMRWSSPGVVSNRFEDARCE